MHGCYLLVSAHSRGFILYIVKYRVSTFKPKRGRKEQLWYFRELLKVYEDRGSNRLVKELKRVVDELDELSADESGANS